MGLHPGDPAAVKFRKINPIRNPEYVSCRQSSLWSQISFETTLYEQTLVKYQACCEIHRIRPFSASRRRALVLA